MEKNVNFNKFTKHFKYATHINWTILALLYSLFGLTKEILKYYMSSENLFNNSVNETGSATYD